MIKFGEVLEKFPPELKDAVITLYDFLREEYVIKREEFEELKSIVKSLAIAQEKTEERLNQLTEKIEQLAEAQRKTEEKVEQLVEVQRETEERLNRLTERVEQLAEAQRKTEERVEQLAEAQRKTEERLNRLTERVEQLAEAQRKTEERLNRLTERVEQLAEAQRETEERLNRLTERVEQLAEAQRKTEERLNRLTERVEQLTEAQRKTEEELRSLAKTVKNMQKELGGLSHSIGFDLENQAYKALPEILKERYGIEIEERLLRKFIEYPDGREEEINIFGKGRKNGETIYIIGEAKTHLKLKDIDLFKRRLERINRVIPDKKFPIFVVHSSSPKVVKYAEDNGFPVFFSYEF